MLEELQRRNYAESTIHIYIHTVEHFSRHFHRSPDQLDPEHIRQYQAALFTRWKLAPNTEHCGRVRTFRYFRAGPVKTIHIGVEIGLDVRAGLENDAPNALLAQLIGDKRASKSGSDDRDIACDGNVCHNRATSGASRG